MNLTTKIHLNKFKLRPYQLPFYDAIENKGYKRALLIWPRRAGKDVAVFNLCIRYAMRKVCVIYYIFPTYAQGKKVIFDSITNDGTRILDYIPPEIIESKNTQELKIRFKNGSLLQVVGSDNYDSLMGTNPQLCVFSEYALQDPRAYQYIRPILTANDGTAIFLSTPRGKNHLYELYQIAKQNPQWYCQKLSVEDTNHIPLEEIEKERQSGEMSEDLIAQEYYCFPAGQEVLTSTGSKPIEQIKNNDMVVSHTGRIRKVLKTIEREYKGSLYCFSSYGSAEPIICTSDHPIRIYEKKTQKYTWKKASEIDIDDRLVFPKMHFGSFEIINLNLCKLIAWYITEGSCFKNGVQWTVNKDEEKEITSLLATLGLYGWETYEQNNAVNIVYNSVQLVDFFKANCGTEANDKKIPFDLIAGYEDEFFHELIKGDGCHNISNGHEKYSYTTVSKSLAYQIQILANSLNLGYAAGISVQEARVGEIRNKKINCQKSYQINISFPGLRKEGKLMRAKNCIAAKITNIEINPRFEGKVYNLSVQYDESYLVNGRAVHNCSFDMGVEGAYYAKYIDRLRLKGQIGIVPYEEGFRVNTSWDLGVRDSTTIIAWQSIGQTIRLIWCYEKQKEGLEHYIRVLENKAAQEGWVFNKHIFPHDVRVMELGSGITRIEKLRQLGIKATIADEVSIMDGIECVRSNFNKLWIDEKNCAPLIKALENYRQEYDIKRKTYKSNPLHDWSSHYADNLRYLCVSLPKTKDGLSSEDLDRRYIEAYAGNSLPGPFNDDFNTTGFR